MPDVAGRGSARAHGHRAVDAPGDGFPPPPAPTRHPLVAAAMVLPLAALLAVVFGGWDAVVAQASSVAGLLGR
ncbi:MULTISPECIES: hypothetical protein [Streptomyces]|uniref:Uncharacterized protein n=1 Tax=Streptomyces luteosporeus TaxID=173856 RepID=A0ABN3TMW8_9ACTN